MPYVTPRYDFAQPHRDGTALVFSRDIDETIASIRHFSRRDAETYREWNRKADLISDWIFLPERFSEPLPEPERDALLGKSQIGRDFLEIINRQPLDAVRELFENELVQLLVLFKLSLFGTVLYDQVTSRSPMGALLRGFDHAAGYQVCVGGSVSLARGLAEAFVKAGGRLMTGAHVERIIVEAGRATGVELADGRTLRARQFVASTIDVPQTFRKMVGFEQLPADYRKKVENFKHTDWSLYGLHLCLKELPRHLGTEFDPNVNRRAEDQSRLRVARAAFRASCRGCRKEDPVARLLRDRPDHLFRPEPGAARLSYRLCLARDAVRARRQSRQHRSREGGVC